jgi:cytochrome c-type biogenesis protein CcmH
MRMSRVFALLILLAAASVSAATVDEAVVQEIGSGLRCVVCQNLSVADSPSEMANQMRGVIRERLAAGDTPEQVVHYFVDKYGEWILLSPAPHGFNLVVWVAPALAVLIGLAAVALLLRRWTRPRRSSGPVGPVDPAIRERIRREIGAEP